jgi:hypothetical protein
MVTLYCVTYRDGPDRFKFCFFSDVALKAFLRGVGRDE